MGVRWRISGKMRGMGGDYSFDNQFKDKPAATRAFDKFRNAPETIIEATLWRDGKKVERIQGYQFDDAIPF